MYEDHYAYEQRAERLRDYAPQISHSAALMQARFEAHGLGQLRPGTPSVPAVDAPQASAPNDSTESIQPDPSQA